MPLPGSHFSAQAVSAGSGYFLIDCGEGTQFRLRELQLGFSRLKGIAISHLHGDHYFGLFGLLNTLSMSGRREPLYLFGPPGLDSAITEILRHGRTVLPYPLRFTPTSEQMGAEVFREENLCIETFPLQHRIHCTGFLFREKIQKRKVIRERLPEGILFDEIRSLKDGKDVYGADGTLKYSAAFHTQAVNRDCAYAYCSDTLYQPGLADYLQGVDLLYHEATFLDELATKATATGHSTARQAAMLARDSRAGRLLLGHLSSRYTTPEAIVEEARSVFPATSYAEESMVFEAEGLSREESAF